MNILKLISTQKNILCFLAFVLISGMIFTACTDIDITPKKYGCRDVEPTLEGEFVECNDCLLEVGDDKLTVTTMKDGNEMIPYDAVTRYGNYDDVFIRYYTPQGESFDITDLAIVGIGEDVRSLKVKAKGFKNINGNLVQTDTNQKVLSIPDSKDYCQISFLYKIISTNFDEILYEIELDTGQDEMVRMKLSYIPYK